MGSGSVMKRRAALYYVPAADDPLLRLGNAWLGRDPEAVGCLRHPVSPEIAEITAEPRHYGFHATLRAPMRLVAGWPDFLRCARVIAQATPPCRLPELEIAQLDGFLALVLTAPCPALAALAEKCVRETEALRAPLNEAELSRRQQMPLTPRQNAMLREWGYPQVLQEWRFHMTLTRRLRPQEMRAVSTAAARHFGPVLGTPRHCAEIAVFTEQAESPMRNVCRLPLGAQ